jgi:UDP-N-acetylmuramoyl-L-alanyl-D-glutamate--2,6-diaminopimelate ligase
LIGVTGTNGKTTVTQLVHSVLAAAGHHTSVLGTLSGARTTPEATDLQPFLAQRVRAGDTAVVMEVSSHALLLNRVNGCRYRVAAFTNLSQDHLDLHGTMEAYFEAKSVLFEPDLCEHAVFNTDDPAGEVLRGRAERAGGPHSTYSLSDVAGLRIDAGEHRYAWRGVEIVCSLGGRFNASNSLAAATICAQLGLAPDVIADGLRAAPPVPGRLERVGPPDTPFDVVVDYAHTPDGLHSVLTSLRDVLAHRGAGGLIVVIGCGGDRDHEKRPIMGRVAAQCADVAVITSDNPRSEDPVAIVNAMFAGVPDDYRDHVVIEVDRRHAIFRAVAAAKPGDIVVIAGKGHETTQTIGDAQLGFDDRVVATEALEECT